MKYYKLVDGQKYPGKNPEVVENLDFVDDASEVLEPGDVVIDFDDITPAQKEYLVNKYTTRTVFTKRGLHMYFKSGKRAINGYNLLGLKTELLTRQVRPYGVVIKRDGVVRKETNSNSIMTLPEELAPRKELLGLDHASGRNDFLFNQIVQSDKIGVERDLIVGFLQNFVFDEPLPEKEVDELLKSIDKNGSKGTTVDSSTKLINDYHIKNYLGSTFVFIDGRYEKINSGGNPGMQIMRFVASLFEDSTSSYMTEVAKLIINKAPNVTDTSFNLHLAGSKAIDRITGEIVNRSPEEFSPYYIDVIYDEKATPSRELVSLFKNFSDTPKSSPMPEIWHTFIGEFFGISLVTDPRKLKQLGKTFILVGDGGNGKSTMVELLSLLLGDDNVSANSLQELGKSGYMGSMLNALANVGEDLDDSMIKEEAMRRLKNITTGDKISAKVLYSEAETFRLPVSMYFTANQVNKMSDTSYGMERRLIWIEFNATPEKDLFVYQSGDFASHLYTDQNKQYLFKIAVAGLQRLYAKNDWDLPGEIDLFSSENFRENNPLADFLSDKSVYDINGKAIKDVYSEYEVYCLNNGIRNADKLNKSLVSKNIKKWFAKLNYGLASDKQKTIYQLDAETGKYKQLKLRVYSIMNTEDIEPDRVIDHYEEQREKYNAQNSIFPNHPAH